MEISDRKIIWGLIALQLLVCLPFVNSFPVALDEPFSIFHAQQNLNEFVPILNQGNNSPLYFIVLHFWIKLFGISALGVRSLSIVFSLVTIVYFYKISKLSLSGYVKFLPVLFFIFSRFFHYHSMEARMYMLFTMFFTILIHQALQLANRNDKMQTIGVFVIVNILIFYTHYLAVFVYIAELAFLVLNFKHINLKKMYFPLLITACAIGPGIYLMINRLATDSGQTTWVPTPQLTELYGNIIRFFNNTVTLCLVVLLFIALFYLLKVKLKVYFNQIFRDHYLTSYGVLFFIPYLVMFTFSLFSHSVFLDRYILFTCIPLFLLFAQLVNHFNSIDKKIIVLAFAIPLVFSMRFYPQNNRDIDKIVSIIKANEYNEGQLYISPPWLLHTILYHYDIDTFKSYKKIAGYNGIVSIYNLEEVKDHQNITILCSKDGSITPEQIVDYYSNSSFELQSMEVFNNMYSLFHFRKL